MPEPTAEVDRLDRRYRDAWVTPQTGDLDQRVADGEDGHQILSRVTRAFESIATKHSGETVAVPRRARGRGLALHGLARHRQLTNG